MKAVKVPPEVLQGFLEEFVTRDGTDYGEIEVSTETKVSQVLNQLKSGKAGIVWDTVTETYNILNAGDPAVKKIN